jgi:hypothetical protein
MQRTLQRGLKVPEAAAGTAVSGAVALRFQVVLARSLTGGMQPWPLSRVRPLAMARAGIMLIAAVMLGRHRAKTGA